MKPETKEFRSKAAQTLEDKTVLQSLEHVYTGFHEGRLKAAADTPDWEDLRTKGKAIKDHTIAHLDYYLGLLADNVEMNGGHVFFADDAAEARKHIIDLAHTREIKTVIKSKSMVSEEMALADALIEEGIEAVETDLGEYIIQLAGETPYHLIAPAIHKSRQEVAALLDDNFTVGDPIPGAGRISPGDYEQRAGQTAGRSANARVAELHQVRRLPERVPGLQKGWRARLWVGLSRSDRVGSFASINRPERRPRPAQRFVVMRSLPRGVSGKDQHSPHAAGTPLASG
jgi:hypothetical protein